MSTQKIISSRQPRKNLGGTIFKTSPAGFDRTFIGTDIRYVGFYASRYNVMGDTNYIQKIVSNAFWVAGANQYGNMRKNDYIMQGLIYKARITSPAGQNLHFHKLLSAETRFSRQRLNFDIRTRQVVTAGWNEFTGQPLVTPTLSHDSFIRTGAATIDTRAIPGKFNYVAGYKGSGKGAPKNTVSQNYNEKTG